MRQISKYYFIPAVLWFLLIFILLILPSDDFEGTSLSLIPYFDKIVHAGLFGALVFWITLPLAKRVAPTDSILLKIAIYVSLYGIVMEYVQKYFTATRTFDVTDMLADTVGAFLSYFVMRIIFKQYQSRRSVAA